MATTADPNRTYFDFYLMGRDEAGDDADEVDTDYQEHARRAVASATTGSPNVRDIAMVVAKDAAKQLEPMNAWVESSRALRKALKLAGGDNALAYKLYVAGYTDELAQFVENEILATIVEGIDDEDGDDDEDDEDDGDDDADVTKDDD